MTIKEAKQALSAVGMQIRKVDGEYQVYPHGGGDKYYTDDLTDAVQTGLRMGAAQ